MTTKEFEVPAPTVDQRTQPQKYHIWTIGCQMNVADSNLVAANLESLGLIATHDIDSADIVVLNTCVVRQSAENKAVGKLEASSLGAMQSRIALWP